MHDLIGFFLFEAFQEDSVEGYPEQFPLGEFEVGGQSLQGDFVGTIGI